jgi:CubicO group peptidase (beta-lactamase class C family)
LERNFAHRWGTNKLIDLSYHHPDNFKPGQGWGYNNTGYLLLGRIIEKVTHQPLSYVLNKEFFKPLEMSHTYYTENDYPPVIFEQLAKGYYNTKEVKASIGYNLGSSAGGIIMNGDDLANWISKLLVTKSLLPEKQLNEMLMGVRADKIKPEDSKFGLGIILTKRDKLGEIIWYTGVTPTHTAAYIWIPSKNVLIIALASFDRHGDKDYDLLFPQNELLSKVIDVLT